MKRVLVVEDNRDIAHLVGLHLDDIGVMVDKAYDGNKALSLIKRQTYDLIILDLMLPGKDGLEVCREMRRDKINTPILILTAKSTELDRVLGLELGADDYLTKPFSVRELIARVKAIFRRSDIYKQEKQGRQNSQLCIGELNLKNASRSATLRSEQVSLTATEFELLWHFASHPGQVFSRNQLLDSVWGYGHDGYEHTVNSHINRLRAKIEHDPTHPKYILTVWGVGYKFTEVIKCIAN